MTVRKKVDEVEELMKIIERYGQTLEKVDKVDKRLDQIGIALEKARVNDILLNYTNPHRVFWINVIVGVGRGLGLTIGTVIVLSLLGLMLQQFVDMPLIGEWISNLMQYVDRPEFQSGSTSQ